MCFVLGVCDPCNSSSHITVDILVQLFVSFMTFLFLVWPSYPRNNSGYIGTVPSSTITKKQTKIHVIICTEYTGKGECGDPIGILGSVMVSTLSSEWQYMPG